MDASLSESSYAIAVSPISPTTSPISPSHRSFRQRNNGLSLSAMAILYLTIFLNCWFHHEPTMLTDLLAFQYDSYSSLWWSSSWNYKILWHSHNYTTLTSTVASLFTHADWGHVFSNMFILWMMGKQLFIPEDNYRTQQQQQQQQRQRQGQHFRSNPWTLFSWTSPLAFLWFYLGSQFLSVVGCRMICYWLDREWSRKVAQDRAMWSFQWQWVPDSWKDTWFTVSNAQQAVELRVWKFTPVIGSSAAVFGVVGAHVYAALCCSDHPAEMDFRAKTIWLGKIGIELAKTPLSLEQISLLEPGDNIDHASHICGFMGGFFLAFVWDRVFCTSSRRRYNQHHENEMQDV